MPDAIVTRPFTAHLVLEGVERRLEVGERVAADELAHWGRSVDHLVNTRRLALIQDVAAADASIESLVSALVSRSHELGVKQVAKLERLLGQRAQTAAKQASEGDGATVAAGGPGGDPPSSPAPSPSDVTEPSGP